MPIKRPGYSSGLENEVRKYYDDNTKMFLKHGEHGSTYGIHQPIYFKSTDDIVTAMHAQHRMILERMRVADDPYHVLDLGCGIGSSILYLMGQTPQNVHFTGITISPDQVYLANKNVTTTAARDRIRFICGSFQQIPQSLPKFDLAYGIESFIHSPDVTVFFQQVSRNLKTGGILIIFDDILRRDAITKQEKRVLREFRTGWKANNLHQIDRLTKLANGEQLSLDENVDLSPYLKLGRPRDKVIAAAAPFLRIMPVLNSYATFLLGGNARQLGFKAGLLGYRIIVFSKR